mmetsp:Transcript_21108/g.32016  ORF Transcript_21108/g.32016 Transcript_21108/m.32016 type:complete len:304 (-) Transcript_21108:79-990(-)
MTVSREEARSLSPLVIHDSSNDEKSRLYRKKHSSRGRERDVMTVSREELVDIKRSHEKELKNLLKFLEKESVLLSGIEEEKREELDELNRKHEQELRKLFELMERQLIDATEDHAKKQGDLLEEIEMFEEHTFTLEEELESLAQELQSEKQKSKYEISKPMNELSISERQTDVLEKELTLLRDASVMQSSRLENELIMLREQLAEKDRKILQFEGMKTKASFVEEQLKNDLRRKDEEIKRREEDMKRKDKTITQKNEEILQLISNGPHCFPPGQPPACIPPGSCPAGPIFELQNKIYPLTDRI